MKNTPAPLLAKCSRIIVARKTGDNSSNAARIEKEIAEKVNESMDKNQRDYYLHEQLHIINDELGEGDDTHAEADDYRRKIREPHLA